MYCPNCGISLNEKADFCVKCGVSVSKINTNQTMTVEDKPNVLVNILSLCCIPILGIILYFVWKDKQPKAAKSALTFGLIGIFISIIIWFFSFMLGMMDTMYYFY